MLGGFIFQSYLFTKSNLTPMKSLLFVMLMMTCTSFGQSLNGSYFWNAPVFIQQCEVDGTIKKGGNPAKDVSPIDAPKGQQFNVLGLYKDTSRSSVEYVIIRILDYTVSTNKTDKKNPRLTGDNIKPTPFFYKYNFEGDTSLQQTLSSEEVNAHYYKANQKYFRVERKVLEEYATKDTKLIGSMAFGIVTLPFKYRIQKGKQDFSGSFNVSAAVGFTFARKEYRKSQYTILVGAGISNVTLDSASVSRNANNLSSSNNFSALTMMTGVVLTYEKVQVGVFMGVDRLGIQNNLTYGWRYQGDPWLSIGLGFSIFSVKQDDKKDTPALSQKNP